MHEGVPVIPCGIEAFGWSLKNPRPFAVVFGEPMDLSAFPVNGRGYKEAAGVIEAELFRLWRLAAEAVAEEFPDRLLDGTRREHWPRLWDLHPAAKGKPWPSEEWARGPLGPVYREAR